MAANEPGAMCVHAKMINLNQGVLANALRTKLNADRMFFNLHVHTCMTEQQQQNYLHKLSSEGVGGGIQQGALSGCLRARGFIAQDAVARGSNPGE